MARRDILFLCFHFFKNRLLSRVVLVSIAAAAILKLFIEDKKLHEIAVVVYVANHNNANSDVPTKPKTSKYGND